MVAISTESGIIQPSNQKGNQMVKFKVEIEVVLVEGSNPDFIFNSIVEQLEEGEALTVARYIEVTEE